jgi:hypothetical protein
MALEHVPYGSSSTAVRLRLSPVLGYRSIPMSQDDETANLINSNRGSGSWFLPSSRLSSLFYLRLDKEILLRGFAEVCTYSSPALWYVSRSHRVCVLEYEKLQITSKKYGLLQRAWRSISGYFSEYYSQKDFTCL